MPQACAARRSWGLNTLYRWEYPSGMDLRSKKKRGATGDQVSSLLARAYFLSGREHQQDVADLASYATSPVQRGRRAHESLSHGAR